MSANLAQNLMPDNKYIYNHDITTCSAESVTGNHLYSGRALGITQPWDMIQLHEDLQPYWNDITAHYDRIGLSYSKNVVWYLDFKELGAHIGYRPSVFFYGTNENQFWGDNDWLNIVDYINSKNNFMSVANQLGVDVPITLCFDSIYDIKPNDLKKVPYPCYLKSAISVSGAGVYRCETHADLLINLEKFDKNIPVQIQEEVITDTFLNLQYKVVGNEVLRVETSEQILDGFVHQINRVPSSHSTWDTLDEFAYWLLCKGMKGIFAFELAVVKTPTGYRYPAIKCKPHYNAATYPTLIARKLNIATWSTKTFTTKYRKLSDIDLSEIEYDKKSGEGAIIINWGIISEGEIVILLAGSNEYQEALEVELTARL